MRIRYDVEKMKRIISDLCVLTGISMSFLDTERRTLCRYTRSGDFCSTLQSDEKNERLCACSDEKILNRCLESKRFESHICHAGLFDAAMPIVKDGIVAGIVLMGRVRLSGSSEVEAVEADGALSALYSEIPTLRDEQIASLGTLLPNVLFESAVFIEFDDQTGEIIEYIKNNLSAELSVSAICKRFHISKNRLYSSFREYCGRTVTEYITDVRMEAARSLLRDTGAPVYEIAEAVGIDNYTYFCKLFKKREGISPTEYRKASR